MKASILINNYNYASYLEETLISVLNQTYDNTEIIVYDDGSSDNSLEIINKYKDQIKILAFPNYGKGHCWNQINAVNKAFEYSTGDIIFLLDSDDLFHLNKVEKVISEFKNNKDLIYYQHPFNLIDQNGNKLKKEKRPFLPSEKLNLIDFIYFIGKIDFSFTQTSGQCFRRNFLEKILPLKEDNKDLVCVDIRLSRIAAFSGEVKNSSEALGDYRIHIKNHSSNLKDQHYFKKLEKQQYDFFNEIAKKYNKKELKKKNKFVIYIRLILFLIFYKINVKEKVLFLKKWYFSLKN